MEGYTALVPASSTLGRGPLRIERSRLQTIMALALPIIGGMGSQNLLNLIDTFMVSRLGGPSIAAVGMGAYLNFLSIAFITGLSAGVQAMASRRKGEGRHDETAVPLNGGLVLVLVLALPLSFILFLLAPWIFPLVNSDPKVVEIGTDYYQMRLLGMVAVGANFAFRGYWNGVSLSKLYLRTLLIMHASNVLISLVLIFGSAQLVGIELIPAMGAAGSGLGTTISTYIGTGYYVYLALRHARGAGFLHGIPTAETFKSMLRLSVPSAAQQALFAGGFTLLFKIIGMVGTDELAAANVLVNIMLVAILPGLGLGLASASLVGQALGRGDANDAEAWGWDVARVAAIVIAVVGLPMVLFPRAIMEVFLFDEPDALAVAVTPLLLVGVTAALDAVGMVLLNSLMGAGATMMAMIVSISAQWLIFLPLAYLVGPWLGFGLAGIWAVQVGYRVLQAGVLAAIWRSRMWSHVDV